MVKILSALGVISTMIVVLSLVGILSGSAQIELNMNHDKRGVSEESIDAQNPFFITREIANILNSEYTSSSKEYAACMRVNQIAETLDASIKVSYILTGFDSNLRFFGESFSQIDYCNGGMVHSHPQGTCYFSVADIYSFKDRIKKGEYFSVLVCGVDDFRYITRNDFTERKVVIQE